MIRTDAQQQSSRMPSRTMLWSLVAIGVILMITGIGIGFWHWYHDYAVTQYVNTSTYQAVRYPFIQSTELHTRIHWYEYLPTAVAGWIIVWVAYNYITKFYKVVKRGKVIAMGACPDTRDTWIYYAILNGNNLAGQPTQYTQIMDEETWLALNVGDMFTAA